MQKLEDEIEKVYQDAESSLVVHDLDFRSQDTLRASLVRALSEVGLRNAEQLSYDESLFAYGLDSLQTLRLSKAIQPSLDNGASSSALKTMIYNNATIDKIAEALRKLNSGETVQSDDPEAAMTEMKRILHNCQASLETADSVCAEPTVPLQSVHVLLTGSTGGLGSYMLDVLIADPSIRITCLNRTGSNAAKQEKINAEKGLCVDFSRVEFLEVDLTRASTFRLLHSKIRSGVAETWLSSRCEALAGRTFNSFPVLEPPIAGLTSLRNLCQRRSYWIFQFPRIWAMPSQSKSLNCCLTMLVRNIGSLQRSAV